MGWVQVTCWICRYKVWYGFHMGWVQVTCLMCEVEVAWYEFGVGHLMCGYKWLDMGWCVGYGLVCGL